MRYRFKEGVAIITDPQIIKFCNEQLRPMCDAVCNVTHRGDVLAQIWDAKALATLVPATDDVVDDGSATDGRTPITGNELLAAMAVLAALRGALGANSRASLAVITRPAVNVF